MYTKSAHRLVVVYNGVYHSPVYRDYYVWECEVAHLSSCWLIDHRKLTIGKDLVYESVLDINGAKGKASVNIQRGSKGRWPDLTSLSTVLGLLKNKGMRDNVQLYT